MSETEEKPQSPPNEDTEVNENGDGEKAKPNDEEPMDESINVKEKNINEDGDHAKSDDDAKEEEKVGLLEQPVVLEGKRQRKKTERLAENISKAQEEESKSKEVVIPEGSGVALGDIEYIQYQLNRTKAEDLKLLHRILFGKAGTANEVKRNIRKFKGFSFSRDSKEHDKKMDILNRVFVQPMKQILEIIGLERSGNKEELVKRLVEFLYKPVDHHKKVPKPKKRGRGGGEKGKQKRKSKGGEKGKKSGSASSKAEVSGSDDDSSDNEEESDAAADSGSESEAEKAPPKKKAKTEKKKATPTPKKKATPKKSPKKAKSEKVVLPSDSDSDSDSDDEPLVKKKKPPTDDELREAIKVILDGADLEEITMKSVCRDVYAKYPDFDLVPRKAFIKATVKDIIN